MGITRETKPDYAMTWLKTRIKVNKKRQKPTNATAKKIDQTQKVNLLFQTYR